MHTEENSLAKRTVSLLDRSGIRPSKARGQHFLVDANIVGKIISVAQVDKTDVVLEVGPGVGALTDALSEHAKAVVAVEFDHGLVALLKDYLDAPNIHLVSADALEIGPADLPQHSGSPNKMVSNLPYNIAAPLLLNQLLSFPQISTFVVTVQAEIAERITAQPGSKRYGSLTPKIQYLASAKVVHNLSPNVFLPRPAVDSAIVKLTRHGRPPVAVESQKLLFAVVTAAFSTRRKTLRKSLTREFHDREAVTRAIDQAKIDPMRRGESLALPEFAELANRLSDNLGPGSF
ncbi:MAG: 16S rRNA (adenine(1518)-N(6)/adenine(1519)-N(6))-dimethyltransferase RsmA [Terriglobia bacterium]